MDLSESVGINPSGESGQESLNEARSDKSLAMFLAVFSYLYIFTLRNVSIQHDYAVQFPSSTA